MGRKFLFVLAVSLFSAMANSTTYHVQPPETIQAAIDSAVNGDTVLVADGQYYERISYKGKGIIVASNLLIDGNFLHIQNTIIDGDTAVLGISDTGSVVRFVNDEDSNSVIYGFTIRNGYGTLSDGERLGGGIYIYNHWNWPWPPPVRIDNCVISGNSAQEGGGISASKCSVLINNCVISENIGGGFLGVTCGMTFLNTKIINNSSDFGIRSHNEDYSTASYITMDGCTVEGNGGGIAVPLGRISNSVISNNMGDGIFFFFWFPYGKRDKAEFDYSSSTEVDNCIIENNSGIGIYSAWYCPGFECPYLLLVRRSIIKGNATAIMYNSDVLFEIDSCDFIDNGTGLRGSLLNESASGNVTNSIFQNNGLAIYATRVNLANCIFIENADGAYHSQRPDQNISNCTFVSNATNSGAAIYIEIEGYYGKKTEMDNCIFFNNGSEGAIACSSPTTDTIISISCTDIYGNSGGDWTGCISGQANINGNISADPLFCDTANNDFHLNNVSPCLPANNDCGVQIGAYGVGCATFICGDANHSGAVNALDITYLINYLYKHGPAPNPWQSGDANGNGKINALDVTYLINFLYKHGPAPFCGTVTDIDGNVYQAVKIGNQWWTAENLKVTHYSNGDAMPNVTDNATWAGLTAGAYCEYNNDVNNVAIYGRLYNWYAVNDSRNIAPTGWHVASDAEWKQLEMYLGMSQTEADATGLRGTDEGGKLKETGTTHWASPNTGATDENGFSGLPGAYRTDYGYYYNLGYSAHFWSSTEYGSLNAWFRLLIFNSSAVYRESNFKVNGVSVRCVKD